MINLIVSCSGKKKDVPMRALDIYDGTWWRILRKSIDPTKCRVFVLSAKYGLIDAETVIEPYNKKLSSSGKLKDYEVSVLSMTFKVLDQLKNLDLEHAYFCGGSDYRKLINKTPLKVTFIGNDSDGIGTKGGALKQFLEAL